MAADDKSAIREDDYGDNWWRDTHDLFVAESKDKEPDALFIGDSHIALLEQTEVFQELFAPLHCLCFGICNDSTSNLLWRIENGELDEVKPKVIVLSIGSCNRQSSADDILKGIRRIVEVITEKQAQAEIFVLKLLPTGRKPNPRREVVRKVNENLAATLSKMVRMKVLDVDPGFLGADGSIDAHDMFDYRHLTQQGYRKAFEIVHVSVQSVLNPDQ